KKESMSIYLCFIQHILWSLKEDGKAAIVVPTGFITAQSGIEKAVRQTIVEKRWLKGVISMPSNIFANTGTNVSVLFIDKSNKDGNIMLIDASKLGEKRKEGKNQKTVLRPDEVERIENTFINQVEVEDFSVSVTYEQIAEKNYSLSAGQYFEVKIEFVELSQEEFEKRMLAYSSRLEKLFTEGKTLEDEIQKRLGELKYE
ncbi:MAG: SAM-dependent methyltransferase, partial [Candidatus Gastranaerophilales bacterium]|nr:SAM-dependent methyltransferase [Candidatus Gastranaerophilales bacterium]